MDFILYYFKKILENEPGVPSSALCNPGAFAKQLALRQQFCSELHSGAGAASPEQLLPQSAAPAAPEEDQNIPLVENRDIICPLG